MILKGDLTLEYKSEMKPKYLQVFKMKSNTNYKYSYK